MIDRITQLRAAEAGLPAAESNPDAPLVCFPLKIDWTNTLPILPETYPAPQVSSRDESVTGVSTPVVPALKLAEFARENGWDVRMQYSRGRPPHATNGTPGMLKEYVGLRFGNHPLTDRMAYAIYSSPADRGDWSWDSFLIWGPDLPPCADVDLSALQAFLVMSAITDTDAMRSWVRDLREIKANGVALQKRRDAARKSVRQLASVIEMSMAGMSWPGQLMVAARMQHEMAGNVYTPENLIKFVQSRKTNDREGMR